MDLDRSADCSKRHSRITCSEKASTSKDGSFNNDSQYHGTQKHHRRDHGKNRERGRNEEWHRGKRFGGKNRDNFRQEESHDRSVEQPSNTLQQPHPQLPPSFPLQQPQTQLPPSFPLQQLHPQQPTSFQAYKFPPDYNYLDDRHTVMMPNMIAPMTSWGVGPMHLTTPVNPTPAAIPLAAGMEMNQTAGTGMNSYAYMGMPADNMFGMMGMGPGYCQYGMVNGQENLMMSPIKEVIHLTKSILYPPNPNAPPPTTRRKPLGCKTVFVGGLPEKATEEIIKEVFQTCGEILTIRMSKKNFCHVRFADESFVINAIHYSGYRIKIENKDETPFTGRLHVDYAEARDDQYEYECQQRALEREARHRERMEQDYYRPPTPPPVVHYSEHEATMLGDKLRAEETFQEAVFVLVTWLERGECNKRNAGSFYSMVQSTNSHVRRLMNEKLKYEDELNKAKLMLKQKMQGISSQFMEIGKVFNTACLQKVWDQFTKPQRKNIELWKKQTEEIKNDHVKEALNDRIEEEMDLSDGEEDESGSKQILDSFEQQKKKLEEELAKFRQELDATRCQLQASVSDKDAMEAEMLHDIDSKSHEIQNLKKALEASTIGMQNLNKKRSSDDSELEEYHSFKRKDPSHSAENDHLAAEFDLLGSASTSSSAVVSLSAMEVRLICWISTFLHVHPFGASIDYICSYLHQIDPNIQPRDVESLMRRYPSTFREDSTGIGASLGKKWKYLGFQL